ncbi:hypothetical protein KZ870_38945, partial [Pseudomonas aeruginosa]|nr:hypothetical protein [Pseudomonas aeruginosa]
MISALKKDLEDKISKTIKDLALKQKIQLEKINIIMQKPPKSELGDLSILTFEFSKILGLNISVITEEIIKQLGNKYETKSMGPYLNIKFNRTEYIKN